MKTARSNDPRFNVNPDGTPMTDSDKRRALIAALEARARETYRDVGEPASDGDDREEGDLGAAVEYWRSVPLSELQWEFDR